MKLVIAEKPSVGRSIASVIGAKEKKDSYFIGNGYIVSWALGHLVSLKEPESSSWSDFDSLPVVPLDNEFTVLDASKGQYKVLKSLMARDDVESLVCATDAGREGEAIFRYIYYSIGCKKPFERLWISSLTDQAIKEGFEHLQDGRNYDNLYKSALSRAKADMIVGYSGTRLFSVKYQQYKPPLSIGRVQTPTLAMIVNREKDIAEFKPEKYFKIQLSIDNGKIIAISDKIGKEDEADSVVSLVNGSDKVICSSVKEEQKSTTAPRLFDLTALQREANKLFGYTAKATLDIVQKLYEDKLCTYPRTDSQYLTDDMYDDVSTLIDHISNTVSFLGGIKCDKEIEKCVNNNKVSDHHAIIPTLEVKSDTLSKLDEKSANILSLICTRLLSATARKHQYKSTTAEFKVDDYAFIAKGKVVTDNGFKDFENAYRASRKVEKDEKEEKEEKVQELPSLSEGDSFSDFSAEKKEKWTKPSPHYNEASLLAAMETAGKEDITEEVERMGLGTTATRAAIIENLISKGYLKRDKKNLLPTDRGMNLIKIVPDKLKTPSMTAEWENKLSLMAKGQYSDKDFISEITDFTALIVNELKDKKITDNPFPVSSEASESVGKCPVCGAEVKKGKFGFYCTSNNKGNTPCGMNVGKVFGYELSKNQIEGLLSGKEIKYTRNGFENTVYSEVEPYEYNGKKGYQWKTKGTKK